MRNLKTIQNIIMCAQYSAKNGHELVFELTVANCITRTHRFHYSDCEIMSAIFDQQSASHIRCEPKVFTKLLDHFYHSPEISIEASVNHFEVKSFHHEQPFDVAGYNGARSNVMKHMTTGLVVNIGEFDEYNFTDCNAASDGLGLSDSRCEELVVCSKEVSSAVSLVPTMNGLHTVVQIYFLFEQRH